MEFFRNVSARKLQLAADQINSCLGLGEMRRVSDYRFHGNVVGEDLVVGVENRAALGEDGLLVNVLLSSQSGVLVVLDHLQIDQAKRKRAEQKNEAEANDCASGSAVPFHLAPR